LVLKDRTLAMLTVMLRPPQSIALLPKAFAAALVTIALVCSLGPPASAAQKKVITLEQLQDMFMNMRTHTGSKKWNVDGDLLWGYFFTDPDPRKLKSVADFLVKNGYRFVDTHPTDNKKTFFLHVERMEHHTPESLNERNLEFYKLADQFHLESYDGMDVGPVE
jgi:hypothetical protein